MWWALAFLSAALLGGYDSAKKVSLRDNAVIPVLFLNTLFCSILFSPFLFKTGFGSWEVQLWFMFKAALVLSSWICGYFAMKHLPLTLVGPVNATRPVLVLLGAVLIFGEQLNLLQGIGVSLAIIAYFLMRRTGKSEGIDFRHNKWVALLIAAVLLGATSGLFDKYLLSPSYLGLDREQALGWYSLYQFVLMSIILVVVWLPRRATGTTFKWRWSIPLISLFLCAADYAYMNAVSQPDALISVVSMIRRGSVLVSFAIGAFLLREKNLRAKALDLSLMLLSMLFLYLGSK